MTYDYKREKSAQLRANSLFEERWLTGKFKAFIAFFTGERRQVPLFDNDDSGAVDCLPGVRDIRVAEIIGTGAQQTFDRDFYPLYRRDKQRWVSVAVAMLLDSTSLPPIHVTQTTDGYYSLDGNHRVSVARALGLLYINAEVVCYHMDENEF